jgi:hypothetical protein
MSTVSSTTRASSSLYSLLKQLQANSASESTGSSFSTSAAKDARGPQGMDQFWNSELESQGITGSKLTDLRTEMDKAANDAKSSSNDPAAVKTAVTKVLKDAGVDTDKIDADMKAQRGRGGPPPSAPPSSTSDSSSSTSLESQLQALGITDTSSFLDSLKSFLSSNSSSSSISDLFSTLPTGSQINVLA